ncbi:MAG: transcriptional regulator [Thermoanaerobaculia bacterium]|nr:transcriptional regulator [Thermoanaerobaculia bacterium]
MSRFDRARRAALVQDLLRHALGRPSDLLPFEVVRDGLKLRHLVDRGLVEVPLDRIVGSIGRAREFNRAFLPRDPALRDRWEEVRQLATGPAGFPPVELYRVGEAYFVADGHHRVSVARALGAPAIEAWVREYLTALPLSPETTVEEILLQEGLADFLDSTGLAGEGPELFRVTVADGYQRLLDHVTVHRHFLGIERGAAVPWPEAVASWLEGVFRPMIEAIRRSRVLARFPGRTEADLYLFVMDHVHHLRERYGGAPPSSTAAVADFEAGGHGPEG